MKHLLPLVLLLLTSCAGIMAPGPDRVMVTSDPPLAEIFLDSAYVGRTPTIVSVPRDGEGMFEIILGGHHTFIEDRDKVLNGWFFPGNLLWLDAAPLTMLIDLIGGSYGKYSTKPLHAELVPEPEPEL